MNPDELSLLEHCLACGSKCCKQCLCVTREEKERIVAFTGQDPFREFKGIYVIDFRDSQCPFLGPTGRCSIQKLKSIECRTWPVTEAIENGKRVLVVDAECPVADKLPEGFVEKARELLATHSEGYVRVFFEVNRKLGFKFRKLE
jgi:Fe-S-cluster containining protein